MDACPRKCWILLNSWIHDINKAAKLCSYCATYHSHCKSKDITPVSALRIELDGYDIDFRIRRITRLEEGRSDHIVESHEKGLMFRARCSISYSPSQRSSESEIERSMEVHGRRMHRKK